MSSRSDFLKEMRKPLKLYEKMMAVVCEKQDISKTELDIMAFLSNNPGKDTASEIVEIRMLPKANVSQAVETLIQKDLVTREQDKNDRRRVHLKLAEKSKTIVDEIHSAQNDYIKVLFMGFTPEELAQFELLNNKILQNTQNYL
ncbi:MAG: MarR family transcriptional regulator [Oscillospiraceae bacterium]